MLHLTDEQLTEAYMNAELSSRERREEQDPDVSNLDAFRPSIRVFLLRQEMIKRGLPVLE